MKCDQELCPSWTGHGCICAVLGAPVEHRRIHNGEDNLDTCTACAWASWDTSPSFADHERRSS